VNRIVKAVLWAIPPIVVLVILPRIAIGYVPASAISEADSLLGVSIPMIIDDFAVFGVVLAVLSAVQTWAYKWSIVKPVASSLHMVTSYVLLLFLLGFGNPMTFGTTNLSISPAVLGSQMSGIGAISVSLVSTFLALVVGVAVIMKAGQKWMKYVEDKNFHGLDTSVEAMKVGA
jgi:polyferredoxin